MLQVEEALLGVEGGGHDHCRIVVIAASLIFIVERVHLIDVLLLLVVGGGSFIAVSVQQTVASRTECQTDNTFFIGHRQTRLVVLPVLRAQRNL